MASSPNSSCVSCGKCIMVSLIGGVEAWVVASSTNGEREYNDSKSWADVSEVVVSAVEGDGAVVRVATRADCLACSNG